MSEVYEFSFPNKAKVVLPKVNVKENWDKVKKVVDEFLKERASEEEGE